MTAETARPDQACPCPCGTAVLDLCGYPPGAELVCPRCGRTFAAAAEGRPPEPRGGPTREPLAPAAPERRSLGAQALAGAKSAAPAASASWLAAKYLMLWTGFLVLVLGGYNLYRLWNGTSVIAWEKFSWKIWGGAIGGAVVFGLVAWALHTYLFIHKPREERARQVEFRKRVSRAGRAAAAAGAPAAEDSPEPPAGAPPDRT